MRSLLIVLIAGFLVTETFAAAQYPFSTRNRYEYGIRSIDKGVSSSIQSKFEDWKSDYYEEQGNLARIKFDEPEYTVSEGIAYGMLIFVYMDNETNDTQDEFDKLWAYYNNFSDGNGLMNWRIHGFDNVDGSGAATDAELDVAVALIMAAEQWNDQSYLDDAKNLIDKIWTHEINSSNLVKPGDQWDGEYNPSYMSTAAFELFKEYDPNHDWQAVIDRSYQLLNDAAHDTTGIFPDWCDASGNAIQGNSDGIYWYMDAVRTPWRLAWAYAWYGHEEARTLCRNLVEGFQNHVQNADVDGNIIGQGIDDPQNIKEKYALDGEPLGYSTNVAMLGGPVCAGMVSEDYTRWVEDGNLAVFTQYSSSYYSATLQLLYALFITGRFHNLTVFDQMDKYWVVSFNPPSPGGDLQVTWNGNSETAGSSKKYLDFLVGTDVTVEILPADGYAFKEFKSHNGVDFFETITENPYTFTVGDSLYNINSYVEEDTSGVSHSIDRNRGITELGVSTLLTGSEVSLNVSIPIHYKGNSSLRICDLSGREVLSTTLAGSGIHSLNLSEESLSKGSYIVRLESGGVLKTDKIILR